MIITINNTHKEHFESKSAHYDSGYVMQSVKQAKCFIRLPRDVVDAPSLQGQFEWGLQPWSGGGCPCPCRKKNNPENQLIVASLWLHSVFFCWVFLTWEQMMTCIPFGHFPSYYGCKQHWILFFSHSGASLSIRKAYLYAANINFICKNMKQKSKKYHFKGAQNPAND